MPLNPDQNEEPDQIEVIEKLKSEGHDSVRMVDKPLPTMEQQIFAEGGPGRGGPGEGSLPWVLGSVPLGTGDVLNITLVHLETNTPNVWYKLTHNHSGTTQGTLPQGGTIDAWHLAAEGGRDIVGETEDPIRSIRGPGTVQLELVGPRNALTGAVPHGSLGTSPEDAWAGEVKGWIA